MDKNEIIRRINEEDDYIRCPKFGNSLTRYIAKNEDGVEDSVIARLLLISEEEVQEIYKSAVEKLRKEINDDYYEEN